MKNILLTIFLLTYTCLPCFCQQTVDEAGLLLLMKNMLPFLPNLSISKPARVFMRQEKTFGLKHIS